MPLIPWAWTLQSDPRVHLKVDPWPPRVASSSALIWTTRVWCTQGWCWMLRQSLNRGTMFWCCGWNNPGRSLVKNSKNQDFWLVNWSTPFFRPPRWPSSFPTWEAWEISIKGEMYTQTNLILYVLYIYTHIFMLHVTYIYIYVTYIRILWMSILYSS